MFPWGHMVVLDNTLVDNLLPLFVLEFVCEHMLDMLGWGNMLLLAHYLVWNSIQGVLVLTDTKTFEVEGILVALLFWGNILLHVFWAESQGICYIVEDSF